ncbi:MAG: TetR/AcrR family transcriptional regulator [Anaerolineales bacterium]|nr:TetR/AcrR family transcriptional regulator [Anaerolineales bacterium]MCA9978128.1 TetR/AcrR family transcriptional regulator [Anaerolineales bacterium]
MDLANWTQIHTHILQLEQEGLVTRTFRRLDPERQHAILNAILDEAVAKGPTSLNIKEVSARAGVSIGSLYQYFGNREGLLTFAVALCGRFVRDTFDSYRPLLAALPLRDALAAYLLGGVEWGQTQTALLQFFARAAYHGDAALQASFVQPIAATIRGMVEEILQTAVARGEMRADLDVATTARLVNALMIAVGDSLLLPYLNTYFQVHSETTTPEALLQALLDLLLHGIGNFPESTT